MAIGFNVGGTLVVPDKTMRKASKPNVLLSVFGDGYEQRIANGINSIKETYSVSFKNRAKDDIDDIVNFFDAQAGVSKFDFTIPGTNAIGAEQTIKVVCDDYTTNFEYDNFYTVTASFRRVYEP